MVAPARELSIVVGSVIAWRWPKEPDPVRRLTGAFIVLAGVSAIAVARQPRLIGTARGFRCVTSSDNGRTE
jgi:hypothetical protein